MHVNYFVDALNKYHAVTYSPSDQIFMGESISSWYILGGHWINYRLLMYVDMYRKPEKGCETQDCCDGKTKLMIQLKMIKGSTDIG